MNHPPNEDEYYDRRIETAPLERLERLQKVRLRRVLRHAYHNCRFYHDRWKREGIDLESILDVNDFQKKIPIITKDDIRKSVNSNDLSGGIDSYRDERIANYAMTSGTTGINTLIGLTNEFMDWFVENHGMREYWMAKMRQRMRVFTIPAGWHFFGMAQNMVLTKMRATCISSWGSMFYRFLPAMIQTIRLFKPEYIIAIPWVIPAMKEECEKLGIEMRELFQSVKYVSLAGEPVTPGFRKSLLEETDISDVFESGGSVDGLWGGGDCYAHDGHHVWMDNDLLEVVDSHRFEAILDEERGRIVSTNLRVGGPLYIRFLGEDLVTRWLEKCPCGRTHQRVEMYDRLSNSFKVGSSLLTPYDVAQVIEKAYGAALFAIINPDRNANKLSIRIARGSVNLNLDSLSEEINELSKKELGIGMDIEWTSSENLPFVHRKLKQVIWEKG